MLRSTITCLCMCAAGLLIAGCSSATAGKVDQTASAKQEAPAAQPSLGAEMKELDRLVSSMQDHPRRPFRKTVRDDRDRTMRLVAEKTDVLIAKLNTAGPESALTGAWAADKGGAADLRSGLQSVNQAARRNDTNAVVSSYAKVRARCQSLE
jgi:outer membrane murein-binding lipoprotein Lpp